MTKWLMQLYSPTNYVFLYLASCTETDRKLFFLYLWTFFHQFWAPYYALVANESITGHYCTAQTVRKRSQPTVECFSYLLNRVDGKCTTKNAWVYSIPNKCLSQRHVSLLFKILPFFELNTVFYWNVPKLQQSR